MTGIFGSFRRCNPHCGTSDVINTPLVKEINFVTGGTRSNIVVKS